MSASGYKQTCGEVRQRVRFTPVSGHSEAQERVGLKKQTFNVRLAPNSGHKGLWRWMSAYDPKRTLATTEHGWVVGRGGICVHCFKSGRMRENDEIVILKVSLLRAPAERWKSLVDATR